MLGSYVKYWLCVCVCTCTCARTFFSHSKDFSLYTYISHRTRLMVKHRANLGKDSVTDLLSYNKGWVLLGRWRSKSVQKSHRGERLTNLLPACVCRESQFSYLWNGVVGQRFRYLTVLKGIQAGTLPHTYEELEMRDHSSVRGWDPSPVSDSGRTPGISNRNLSKLDARLLTPHELIVQEILTWIHHSYACESQSKWAYQSPE